MAEPAGKTAGKQDRLRAMMLASMPLRVTTQVSVTVLVTVRVLVLVWMVWVSRGRVWGLRRLGRIPRLGCL